MRSQSFFLKHCKLQLQISRIWKPIVTATKVGDRSAQNQRNNCSCKSNSPLYEIMATPVSLTSSLFLCTYAIEHMISLVHSLLAFVVLLVVFICCLPIKFQKKEEMSSGYLLFYCLVPQSNELYSSITILVCLAFLLQTEGRVVAIQFSCTGIWTCLIFAWSDVWWSVWF